MSKIKTIEKKLRRFLREDQIADHENQRLLYARDMMSGNLLDIKAGVTPSLPDLICWPETTEEVSKIIKLAFQERIPVTPYGAGSGVSGGTIPLQAGIILDLKRMNKIEKIEEHEGRFLVTAQCGIIGMHLEEQLQHKDVTLGHFPSSILCATLGGYLACRSAGQLSSKYGKIEDMVEDVEAVLPNGDIIGFGEEIPQYPHIKAKDLLVGTEGCLGIITRTRVKAWPLPQETLWRGLEFKKLSDAFDAMREILQLGLRPAVMRLYDEVDTFLLTHGYDKKPKWWKKYLPELPFKKFVGKKVHHLLFSNASLFQNTFETLSPKVILILGLEGNPQLTKVQLKTILDLSKKRSVRDLGAKPGLHWLKHRYSVSYKMPGVFLDDAFVDTIEVASTWDRLPSLYQNIRHALMPQALVLAHFSHAYVDGCSIYFTILSRTGKPDKDRDRYKELWQKAMEEALQVGATISHHHGIGLLKAKFLPQELASGMEWYRNLKHTLDPKNIMNPGKMGL
ncbi:MAG: FAD-binding oxidoreductase [Deltaproteobacteria bacterium]|nr:MAG: FAD-binding oxidoreductase [Deltaproteobacteria bacterium]